MFTQRMKKNRASISLIVFGVISILFSPLSSILAFAGIGIVSIIIGGIIYIKSMNKKLSGKSISGTFVLLVSIAIFSFSCTVKVPMIPDVGKIEIKEKLPIEAGLLITEETKNYIFMGHPESFTASARPHEFPLGEALERASFQTFSQVFQKVTLVRTSTETKNYKIFIEPKIEDFHFRYDQLSYVGFAVAVLSKIKVRVTLASGETKVWEKSIESPEQKKGPWFFNPGYEKEVGESASEALSFTLRKIALEITEDVSIQQFIQR
jgi:hypothetical protein